jgi:hypothetical protein
VGYLKGTTRHNAQPIEGVPKVKWIFGGKFDKKSLEATELMEQGGTDGW